MAQDIHDRIEAARRRVEELAALDEKLLAAGEWDRLDRARLSLDAAREQLQALRRQRDQAAFERTSLFNARHED